MELELGNQMELELGSQMELELGNQRNRVSYALTFSPHSDMRLLIYHRPARPRFLAFLQTLGR
jgi:hypothetical protein